MKPTRASARERRKAMAKELAAKRAEMRAELARRRKAAGQKKKKKKTNRWWWLWVLLAILLWLLMPDCSCQCREPGAPVVAVTPPAPVAVPEPEPVAPPPAPITGRIDSTARPEFQSKPPPPLPWISAFRMQVAARSPRLSECFVGAPRPGTLRWTTSVEPGQGQVSEHVLEPALLSDALSQTQRDCVLRVLTDPPYTLSVGEARATPSRVGLVIEF